MKHKVKRDIGLPKKKKQPSHKTLKKLAWDAFSKFIRLRDCLKTTGTATHGKCITCGKLAPFGLLDAGHFVSRKYNSTLFDETNCHAQCRFCNRYQNGNLLEYRRQIVKLYGEGYDVELEDKATELKKVTPLDLIEIKEYYAKKFKKLKEKNEN
jgi:hypothetical protein